MPWGGWRVPAGLSHGLGPGPHSYPSATGMRQLVPAYHLVSRFAPYGVAGETLVLYGLSGEALRA